MVESSNSGPLGGLKIIEFSGIGPGPLAGQLLADLGAEVILIDRPRNTQDSREINNRNKKSIVIDLKSKGGLKVCLKLVEKSDILIEGLRPGVMERIGLDPEICFKKNKRLIYGRITGWGQNGALSQTAGHDINYLGLTGALSSIGLKNTAPIPPLNLVADYAGGTMFLIMGILSALWERNRSGAGQIVDAAMVEGVPALMGYIHNMIADGSWINKRESNLLDGGAPFYRCYQTKDGKFLAVGAIEAKFFDELVEHTGIGNFWKDRQNNKKDWRKLTKIFSDVFKTKTRREWENIFTNSNACVTPVLDWNEIADYEHSKNRGIFFSQNGILQASVAPKFSRSIPKAIKQAPLRGADSINILQSLNFSKSEIKKLINDKAIEA